MSKNKECLLKRITRPEPELMDKVCKLMSSPEVTKAHSIFEEEKKKLGIEKEVELMFNIVPLESNSQEMKEYQNSSDVFTFSFKNKDYVVIRDSLVGNEEEIRRNCKFGLYNAYKGNNSRLKFLGKISPTLRKLILGIPAELYATFS